MPKKVNAFAKYMFSLKSSMPNKTMAEIQLLAGENWKKMNAGERAAYQNGKGEAVTRTRYNCFGESIDEVNRLEEEKREKLIKDNKFIENLIKSALNKNRLMDEEVYFFSASSYYRRYPAEIALARFSLEEGIIEDFHMFINPGQLPLGAAYQALEHAKKTHRLPLPPNIIGEKNYQIVLDKILEFLDAKELSSAYVKPFYVYGDDLEEAQETLETICYETNSNNAFRLLPAEQYLYSLNQLVLARCDSSDLIPFSSRIMARNAMSHDNFRYSEPGCEKHYSEDNSHMCALSKVRRWGYSFVEHCGLEINIVPGKHVPITRDIDEIEEFEDESNTCDSILTESFQQLNIKETFSEIDTQSLMFEDISYCSSSNLQRLPSLNFSMESSLRASGSTITDASANLSQKFSGIDETCYKGKSWTKKIAKNHPAEE